MVNRRFNRRRYDAAKTIEAFAARLHEQLDPDAPSTEVLGVVNQTMQPTKASVWLRPPTSAPLDQGDVGHRPDARPHQTSGYQAVGFMKQPVQQDPHDEER
jgi:hypothetical protein